MHIDNIQFDYHPRHLSGCTNQLYSRDSVIFMRGANFSLQKENVQSAFPFPRKKYEIVLPFTFLSYKLELLVIDDEVDHSSFHSLN